jgi:glucokinase
MVHTLVAIDVGASRTRVRVGSEPSEFFSGGDPLIRDIRSASALLALLSEVRSGIDVPGSIHLSAGLAGPPLGGGVRVMTNWPADQRVSADEIRALGFDSVTLMNDLEAAAYGLVAFLEQDPSPEQLVPFGGAALPSGGNRALVMPGSGLGSAGIIDLGSRADPRWHVVPSEAGHTMAGGANEGALLQAMEDLKGRPPTWEDCVSGPGLEALWVATHPGRRDDPLSAPEIAMRAARGDERCQQALDHYYRLAARFSQALALSFLSTGGLFLGGGTTSSNAPLISEKAFLEAFYDNERMGGVLRGIPVFLVLAEINLLGAWTVGWRELQRT